MINQLIGERLAGAGDVGAASQVSIPASLMTSFGGAEGGGAATLAVLVDLARAALLHWAGETDVHQEAAGTLLPVLVRRRLLCKVLARTPAWQHLAGKPHVRHRL